MHPVFKLSENNWLVGRQDTNVTT